MLIFDEYTNYKRVYHYRADPIKYYTQINAKNRHGKYKAGRKVTGLSFIQRRDAYSAVSEGRNTAMSNDLLLLVTTNDSRLRLYQLSDFSLVYSLLYGQHTAFHRSN